MNDKQLEHERIQHWGRRVRVALTLGCSVVVLSACADFLEVDLPAKLTDDVLNDPAGAETLRNSIANEFESGFNYQLWSNFGMEDGGEIVIGSPGIDTGGFRWNVYPAFYFEFYQSARRFANILHAKLTDEWTVQQVPKRAQFLATASLYSGAAIGMLGMAFCEMTLDNGPLLTPGQTLELADQRLTRAIAEITAAGDFEMPFGIASSAKAMAHGLRAQVRWMGDNMSGAQADAEQVPEGFMAWVTRDAGPFRRNKPYFDGVLTRYPYLFQVNDWWTTDPTKSPGAEINPATGQSWPDIIPFTGYPNLGILPDGRAVWDDTGLPIRVAAAPGRTEEKYRRPIEDTAVPDTRVDFDFGVTQPLSFPNYVVGKYTSEADPLPLVNWKEMVLIRAEAAGGQGAIDLVNVLRAADGLPLVTYADPANQQQIRYMLIEERRRVLYIEGRYYFTKLKNLDLLWFPRAEGTTATRRTTYQGAVRLLIPLTEFDLNPNLSRADRATGCPQHERPVDFL